ncbi:MAG: ABC transporter permease subunit, partial [Geminicoccaceae bacterium]
MNQLRRHGLWLFAVAAAALIVAMPEIAGNEYALRFYTLILIYAIIALGLNILVGYAGLISLGQAGLYAIGAYTGAILATRLGIGFLPCLVLGMALAGCFGVLLAYPTVRVRGVYLAVVTIAFGIIVENVAIEWDSLTGSWVGISNVPQPTLLGLPLNFKAYFYFVGASTLITFLICVNIMNSRYGRAMLASGQSEVAARSLGINVTLIRTLAFVLSALTAGAAGVFYVFLNKYISPDIFSFGDSIRFLLMVILGGAGTVLGPIVGAVILSYLPELLQQFGEWQTFVYGALLATVMFVLPRGIVGSIAGLIAWRVPEERRARPEADGKPLSEILAFEPSGQESCLEVRDLSLHFGGLAALDHVTTEIKSGKIHALIGPNGAGKSTFLNAVSGIYAVSGGEISFLG